MSIWSLFSQTVSREVANDECAPPVGVNMNMFDKCEHDSVRPFEAECIVGVVTHRGVKHGFTKPDGSYALHDPRALACIRQRKADAFIALLEANNATEQYFAETFSEDVWGEAPAISGVRVTSQCPQILKRVGT